MKITGIKETNYSYKANTKNLQFMAKPKIKQSSAVQVFSLLTAGCASIISALQMGEQRMNETKKFIDIREDFSIKLEPAGIKTEKTCW